MLIEIAVIAVVCLVVKFWRLQRFWQKAHVPHETFLQHVYSCLIRSRHEDMNSLLLEYKAKYGDLYGSYHGFQPLLRVSDLAVVKDVLNTQFNAIHSRTIDFKTGVPIWDASLIARPYAEWKTLRQLSGTGFTPSKLRHITVKLERMARRFVTQLEQVAEGSAVTEPYVFALSYAIDCLGAIVFGVDFGSSEQLKNEFISQTRSLLSSGIGFFLFTRFPSLIRYTPFISFPNRESAKFIENFAMNAIRQRRQDRAGSGEQGSSGEQRRSGEQTGPGEPAGPGEQTGPGQQTVSGERAGPGEQDLLDVWLKEQESNPEFTDDAIKGQMFFFTIAGADTTAYVLNFAMYLLALHPLNQVKIREDLVINPAREDGTRSFEDYNNMKFVQACIFETLRLYPTDFLIDRQVDTPCIVAGVELEAGAVVQVPVPAVHRNPDIFPEPDAFKPARFLEKAVLDALLAFGDGPKACIGRRVSVHELTVALAIAMENLNFERCPDTPTTLEFYPGMPFMAWPKQQLNIRITKR